MKHAQNVLTEKEAADKICAERCYGQIPVKCCGSECMMWRWFDRRSIGGDEKFFGSDVVRRGYCGLAGPPFRATSRHWWVIRI